MPCSSEGRLQYVQPEFWNVTMFFLYVADRSTCCSVISDDDDSRACKPTTRIFGANQMSAPKISPISKKTSPAPITTSTSSSSGIQRQRSRRHQSNDRPPFSYVELICMALRQDNGRTARLTLREIIAFIERRFPFYAMTTNRQSTSSSSDWRSAVRHCLTMNKCFVKHDREPKSTGCRWSYDACHNDKRPIVTRL